MPTGSTSPHGSDRADDRGAEVRAPGDGAVRRVQRVHRVVRGGDDDAVANDERLRVHVAVERGRCPQTADRGRRRRSVGRDAGARRVVVVGEPLPRRLSRRRRWSWSPRPWSVVVARFCRVVGEASEPPPDEHAARAVAAAITAAAMRGPRVRHPAGLLAPGARLASGPVAPGDVGLAAADLLAPRLGVDRGRAGW